MYSRCISGNHCLDGCDLVKFDNNVENITVPRRYNSFIDSLDEEDCWVVFCHEDWKANEPLSPKVEKFNPDTLYGVVGTVVKHSLFIDLTLTMGYEHHSNKDGSDSRLFRGVRYEAPVDTFDCQCIIVHTSLIKKYGLRFDERMEWDLYVEDFCAAAREKYGIMSRTFKLDCQHYSRGVILQRFWDCLDYEKEKFKDSPHRYGVTVGKCTTFGGNQKRPIMHMHRPLLLKLWQAITD